MHNVLRQLDAALNLAGTKATSADVHLAGGTINNNAYALNIGSPCMPGFPIGMTYPITGHHTLIANLTELTHVFTPPYRQ